MGVQSVLGGTTAWHCEWEKAPSKILAHHWPNVPNLSDITKADWSQVEPIDVLTGGFPCQDVSHAGRRAGLIRQVIPAGIQACGCMWADHDGETCEKATGAGVVPSRTSDKRKRAGAIRSLNALDRHNPKWNRPAQEATRSGLWGHMLQSVDQLRPKLVVAENVRGLLSAKADSDVEPCPFCMGDDADPPMRALGAVLADLADIGYDAWWHGLRAADIGFCHGRFRVFIFATPANAQRGGWNGRTPDALRRQVTRTTPAGSRARLSAAPDLTLLPTPAVNDMGAGKTVEHWDAWTDRMKTEHGNGNGHGKSLSIEALRLLPTPAAYDGDRDGTQHPEKRRAGGHQPSIADVAEHLLPIPRATRGGSATETVNLLPTPRTENNENRQSEGYGGKDGNFYGLINGLTDWGQYAPAIERHAVTIGRPAPAPTEPGKQGKPRLSPAFVEWMQGLPAGRLTNPDIGISRNDQLKAAGNGVIPQQAAAATRWWLNQTIRRATV